ncbi:hypothetical protein L3i23_14020 [Herbiconiux sp. L3-i23]|nr:hypothetical protein L3i23_14020 [Herbiconiux sp. L3-i23]
MADKSLLIGDEAADTLMEYAALIARSGTGDTVTLQAIGFDGSEVAVTFLLNSGTVLLVESSESSLPAPDNGEQVARMLERLRAFDASDAGDTESRSPLQEG